MKGIHVLGAVALLFQLAAGGEVVGSSRYRRTLFSNAGEQPADISAAPANMTAAVNSSSTATMSQAEPMAPAVAAAAGEGMLPTAEAGAGVGAGAGLTGAATAAPAGSADAAQAAAIQKAIAEFINIKIASFLNWFFIGSIIFMTLYRFVRQLIRYIRTVSSLNYPRQEYFAEPNEGFAMLKKQVIHAPMFKHRRAQEFRPIPKIHGGALPTRAQTLYLVIYLGVNVALSVLFITWNQPLPALASQLKNRFGTLAVTNLVSIEFCVNTSNADKF